MLVTTTPGIERRPVTEYLGIVTAQGVLGVNAFKDVGAGIRNIFGGRSRSYENELASGVSDALAEMEQQAAQLGADAVVGVDIDYETVGSNMLMVSASGTAVKLDWPEGRADTSFVAAGGAAQGHGRPQTLQVQVHDQRQPGDEDLLDCAGVHTLLTSETIFAVPPQQIPRPGPAAALLRYWPARHGAAASFHPDSIPGTCQLLGTGLQRNYGPRAVSGNCAGCRQACCRRDAASALFGTVRIQAASTDGAPVFIGIARAPAASRYLAGVGHATVHAARGSSGWYTEHGGGAPAVPPARAFIWDARAAGPGTQTLTWPAHSGTWTVVAMNADGSAPVSVHVSVAATLPALPWIAAGLLAGGAIALAAGVVLLVIPIRRASR
jgi:uncharacterized protein YbjQ (UPF0145 family)